MPFTPETSRAARANATKARSNVTPLVKQAYGVTNRMFKLLCMNADYMISNQAGQITGEQAGVLQCLARSWVMGQERVDFIKGRGKPAERPAPIQQPKARLRRMLTDQKLDGKVIDICCGPAKQLTSSSTEKSEGTKASPQG